MSFITSSPNSTSKTAKISPEIQLESKGPVSSPAFKYLPFRYHENALSKEYKTKVSSLLEKTICKLDRKLNRLEKKTPEEIYDRESAENSLICNALLEISFGIESLGKEKKYNKQDEIKLLKKIEDLMGNIDMTTVNSLKKFNLSLNPVQFNSFFLNPFCFFQNRPQSSGHITFSNVSQLITEQDDLIAIKTDFKPRLKSKKSHSFFKRSRFDLRAVKNQYKSRPAKPLPIEIIYQKLLNLTQEKFKFIFYTSEDMFLGKKRTEIIDQSKFLIGHCAELILEEAQKNTEIISIKDQLIEKILLLNKEIFSMDLEEFFISVTYSIPQGLRLLPRDKMPIKIRNSLELEEAIDFAKSGNWTKDKRMDFTYAYLNGPFLKGFFLSIKALFRDEEILSLMKKYRTPA